MAWSDPGYLYAYGFGTESWIEISSNPSASSLSSAGDEVVTTGLRVQHGVSRQRRNTHSTAPTNLNISSRPHSVGGSSQEEYEESESESEKLMSSSNEGLQLPLPLVPPPYSSSEDGGSEAISDEDEISTAINYRPSDACFTPQPNAFSHPPSNPSARNPQSVPGSYFPAAPRPTNRNAVQRRSFSQTRQQAPQTQHSPFNAISPSHHADHDAALRASLSTLLSCAAAARGLPKSTSRINPPTSTVPPSSNRIDTTTLRMVPGSIALGGQPSSSASPGDPPFNPTLRRPASPARTDSSESRGSAGANPKPSKRKAVAGAVATNNNNNNPTSGVGAAAGGNAGGRSSSRDRRAAKKPRRGTGHPPAGHAHWAASSGVVAAEGLEVSPTLLTWVVSAGVVVLVSALSFGAGFSMGREAGRAEVLGLPEGVAGAGDGWRNVSQAVVGCGRESGMWGGGGSGGGWRSRLRWSGMVGGASSIVA
ncbi:MAG: hypothetical protein Q9165_007491 [Trypethelium subeluteriae]